MPLFPLRGEHHQALSEGLGTRTGAPLLPLTTCTTIACSLEKALREPQEGKCRKRKVTRDWTEKETLIFKSLEDRPKKKKKIKDVC